LKIKLSSWKTGQNYSGEKAAEGEMNAAEEKKATKKALSCGLLGKLNA